MELSTTIATRLQYQHKSLLEVLEGVSEEQVHIKQTPDKWSIFEIIVHLQTYQHIIIKEFLKSGRMNMCQYLKPTMRIQTPYFLKIAKELFVK
jgi:uncharacterized damage-inducible protein DinB